MLNKVEVRTDQGAVLELPLDDISDGFSVQDITGLDPVKANIVSSSFANQDGEQYQASRREKRNIVFKLGLEADYAVETVRQLRNRLYKFFMPKSQVSLRFFTEGEATVDIVGRVESFESPQFTQTPVASISVLCFNPDFEDPTIVTGYGVTVPNTTENVVNYLGTIETGFVFRMNVDRTLSGFTIYNRPADNILRSMEMIIPLLAGDVLEISTIPGQKGVYLNRQGTKTSVLYALSAYSDWLQLFPGNNNFRVTAAQAGVNYTVIYTHKYGGL